MGRKGALNYLPIVFKASIYVPKVMRKPVMGGNTVSETFTHTCFSFEVRQISKSGPGSQIGTWWLSMGGKGALNYLPIVPKAFVYVLKVMHKPVMGGNTVSETFTHMFLFQRLCDVSKRGPDSQFGGWWLSMGGKGALNYLPIVTKAFVYVPKVMRKPVMGGNTVSETFTHMFLFRSAGSFEKWPRQSIWSVMV